LLAFAFWRLGEEFMRTLAHSRAAWLWLAAIAFVVGCSSTKKDSEPVAKTDTKQADTAPADAAPKSDKPFKLGNQIEKFDPPSLADLDKTAQWVNHPVQDALGDLRKAQEASGPTPVSVKDALTLRNNFPPSTEANEKILKTLGRVAPADGAGVDYDQSWVRHVAGDLKSTNPVYISSETEFDFHALTGLNGGTLLTYDRDLKYIAPKDTLVSWQTSKDGLIDKVVLRDDLTWSDGQPLTAHDFEFMFQVVMSDGVPVLALKQNMIQIKYVKAYDDHTLVVFFKEPFASNTETLANLPCFPKHVYEKSIAEDPLMTQTAFHTNLEDHPVTGGPYELVERVRNKEFVVRRRESYYMHNGKQVRPKPYFKEIRMKVIEDLNTALVALKGGQIEEMMLRAEQWANQTSSDDFYARNTRVTSVEWTEFHITWNMKSPFFQDKRVRQAMSWTMDYNEMLNTICQKLYDPCQGPYHPTAWFFPKDSPKPYHQDLKRAQELLDEAGWTDSDGDGIRDKEIDGRRVRFEFELLTYQTETALQSAILFKSCLDQIGIACNVKPLEFTQLVDRQQNHKFEAAIGGWGGGTDPDTSSNMYVTGEGRNYGNYSNKQVDALFEKGRRELDRDKRAAIYGQIHNLLWEDQPYTWLFNRNAFYAFSKKLRGYNFSPTGPYHFDPGIGSLFKAAAAP
jgi:peptide/nickel transport system substrate-binding protein